MKIIYTSAPSSLEHSSRRTSNHHYIQPDTFQPKMSPRISTNVVKSTPTPQHRSIRSLLPFSSLQRDTSRKSADLALRYEIARGYHGDSHKRSTKGMTNIGDSHNSRRRTSSSPNDTAILKWMEFIPDPEAHSDAQVDDEGCEIPPPEILSNSAEFGEGHENQFSLEDFSRDEKEIMRDIIRSRDARKVTRHKHQVPTTRGQHVPTTFVTTRVAFEHSVASETRYAIAYSKMSGAWVDESADAALARALQDLEIKSVQRLDTASVPAMPLPREITCVVCGNAAPVATFPSLTYCTHPSETCRDCYARWIESQLQDNSWREAKCPTGGCRETMLYSDIQQYATREVFEQYDSFAARAAFTKDPNFRFCLAPGCDSGQIHDSENGGDIFTCVACGYKECTRHQVAWHSGETCDQYDHRVQDRQRWHQEEKASIQAVRETTKKCPGPGCAYNIEKNAGCDHMTCLKCGHQFCWVCLCDYRDIRRIGNAAHGPGCEYHTGNVGVFRG